MSSFSAKDEKEKGEEKPANPVVAGLKDPWEIMFARAEGLHAHGHNREACLLGVKLAEELLENPPNLMVELPPVMAKGKRKKVSRKLVCNFPNGLFFKYRILNCVSSDLKMIFDFILSNWFFFFFLQQINPVSHQLSVMASDTLAKCGFLCQVLAENPEHFHLAFRVGLFGLEMPRPPATTKPLEVGIET